MLKFNKSKEKWGKIMVKKISSKNKNNKLKIVSNNENIKSSTARLRLIVFTVLCIFTILVARIIYIEFF